MCIWRTYTHTHIVHTLMRMVSGFEFDHRNNGNWDRSIDREVDYIKDILNIFDLWFVESETDWVQGIALSIASILSAVYICMNRIQHRTTPTINWGTIKGLLRDYRFNHTISQRVSTFGSENCGALNAELFGKSQHVQKVFTLNMPARFRYWL